MRLPLEGLTVLDLSRVLAGPYTTQMLGDLGAEVWKIERPGLGDETRGWGPPFVGETSAYFLSVNRNKKSVVADLNDPAARAAVRHAAERADIVVENFLPGQLARFGLGPTELRAANPDLVVCSITGFGQDGPYAALPGYDAVLQGFVGLMSITGEASGPPLKVGVAIVDVLTGVHAASAILAALVGRLRGMGGAHLDIALFEVGLAGLVNVAQGALVTGEPARRHGNAHPHIVPYRTFDTSDGPIVVAVGNDEQWRRLCEAIGLPEWANDPRWATNAARVRDRAALEPLLVERFASRPRTEWLECLRRADVPAGLVRDLAEVVRDPALVERGLIVGTPPGATGGAPRSSEAAGSAPESPDAARTAPPSPDAAGSARPSPDAAANAPLLALPWLVGGERAAIRLRPPALGEHTAEFFARFGSV